MKVIEFGDPSSNTVLIQPVDDHDLSVIESEVAAIKELSGSSFHLTAIKVDNWNDDLSPWEAPAVFGNEGFGGRAERMLQEINKLTGDGDKTYILGGYSLAGLFSLWAVYETDRFSGVAAVSPSVWFPKFTDYVKKNDIQTKKIYLSLGDREEKTGNPVMSKVGDCIREIYDYYKGEGLNCLLEWNKGNHFKEPDIRTAKGFSRVLKEI